jgi:hypothetical protein
VCADHNADDATPNFAVCRNATAADDDADCAADAVTLPTMLLVLLLMRTVIR